MCKKILASVLSIVVCVALFAVGAFAQTAQVTMAFSAEVVRVSQSEELVITLPDGAVGFSADFTDNGKLVIDRSDMVYDSSIGKYKLSVTLDQNTNLYTISIKGRYVGTAQINLTNIVYQTASGNVSASDLNATIVVKPIATPIYTKQELNAVRNNLSGAYVLMNDIVFEESDFEEGGAFYNDGYGWQPIGSSLKYCFSGEFDGNGYSIRGLKIKKADYNYIGLFGVNKGTIENLAVLGVSIDASYGVFVPTSAAPGTSGNIDYESKDVWTPPSASFDDSDLSGYERDGESSAIAGAVVGYNIGSVSNCFVRGNVCATPVAGGVVGSNVGSVKECSSDAQITAKAAGGIVGCNLNHGAVVDCYTKCQINAAVYGGGICGENSSSSVKYCYSLSTFEGEGNMAGICNGTYYSTVQYAYYLENDDITDVVATALKEEQFAQLRFANDCWDYSGEYPVLKKLAEYADDRIELGDINGDGLINTTDLALLKKFIANLCDENEAPYGDVNEDGTVNTTDLAILKKMIAGLL